MTSTPTPQHTKLLEYGESPLPRYACIYCSSEISSFTVISISKQMMEAVENVFTLTVRVLTQTAEFFVKSKSPHPLPFAKSPHVIIVSH